VFKDGLGKQLMEGCRGFLAPRWWPGWRAKILRF
jgi:hypothetical protein